MRFGLFGGAHRATTGPSRDSQSYRTLADYVREGERLGFSSAFLVEHHFTGTGQVSAPLSLLSYLAGCTSTMRLGTAVTVLPWHNPALLAEQAGTVDLLSDGRLDFGVGRGYRPNEFHGFGVDPSQARDRYEECLAIVLKAWSTEDRFSHEGRYWTYRDVIVEPKPVQKPHPPIWVASGSEAGIRDAAARGFHLLLDQFASVDLTAQRVAWYRSAVEEAGRRYHPEDVAVTRGLLLLDTDDPARREQEIAKRVKLIARLRDSAQIPGSTEPLHAGDHAFFDDSAAATESAAIIGTPDECIDRLRA
ncbi:MAG: LLM class flavin-dependent oxidoreductase, partial [Nitriliruptorales bacterium]|nr:LLM class flavin-dependent oxidoreductase [Nitriliruptorales bacterium]